MLRVLTLIRRGAGTTSRLRGIGTINSRALGPGIIETLRKTCSCRNRDEEDKPA